MAKCALTVLMLTVWAIAILAWPDLPPRIPIHFAFSGSVQGWAAKSPFVWFAVPALATVVGALLGFLLPWWMRRLARCNSRWLNVPHKQLFSALPAEARERAVSTPAAWLVRLACLVQLLFGWIVYGSYRVASGEWVDLPPGPTFVLIAAVLGNAMVLAIVGSRAVKREVALLPRR